MRVFQRALEPLRDNVERFLEVLAHCAVHCELDAAFRVLCNAIQPLPSRQEHRTCGLDEAVPGRQLGRPLSGSERVLGDEEHGEHFLVLLRVRLHVPDSDFDGVSAVVVCYLLPLAEAAPEAAQLEALLRRERELLHGAEKELFAHFALGCALLLVLALLALLQVGEDEHARRHGGSAVEQAHAHKEHHGGLLPAHVRLCDC